MPGKDSSRLVCSAIIRLAAAALLACGDSGGATDTATGTAGTAGGETAGDYTHAWAIALPNVEHTESRTYPTIAATTGGRTLLAGHFDGPLDLGDGPVQPSGMDGFLVALGTDGAPVWNRHWAVPSSSYMFCLGLAADGQGNAVLIGQIDETVDLGGGPLGPGSFAASFTPEGELRWNQIIGTDIILRDVAVAEDGGIVIVGTTGGAYVLGMDPGADNAGDVFALRLGGDGQLVWLQGVGGEGSQTGSFGALAPDGSVLVTGATNAELSLAGTSVASDFVAKLDASGGLQWGHSLGLPASGVAADSQGRVVVAATSGNKSLLLGLGPAGDVRWSHDLHGDLTGSAFDIVVDANDDVLVTGHVYGALDIDEVQFGESGSGPYLLALASDGAPRWIRIFAGEAKGQAITVTSDGVIVLKGSFAGEIDFGGGKLVAGASGGEVFVAAFTH